MENENWLTKNSNGRKLNLSKSAFPRGLRDAYIITFEKPLGTIPVFFEIYIKKLFCLREFFVH